MKITEGINGYEFYRKSMIHSCVIDRLKSMVENIFRIELEGHSYQLKTCTRVFEINDGHISNQYKFRLFVHDDCSIRFIIYDPFNCVMVDAAIKIGENVTAHIEGNLGYHPFVRFKDMINELCDEVTLLFANKKFGDIIKMSVFDAKLELQYIHSEKKISDTISIGDFLKYTEDDCIDNINYSNNIYRISDDALFPLIESHLQHAFSLGKLYRLENVRKSKLFYIENFDLQDITTPGCDDLDFMVDNGYRVINITPENFHQ